MVRRIRRKRKEEAMKDIATIKVYMGGKLITKKNVTDELGVSVQFGPTGNESLIKVEAEATEKKTDGVTGYMNKYLKPETIWSHLSQEAAELSVAANKVAMKLREDEDGDPIEKTLAELVLKACEEYTDTVQLANELHMITNEKQMQEKAERFLKRREALKNPIKEGLKAVEKIDFSLFD